MNSKIDGGSGLESCGKGASGRARHKARRPLVVALALSLAVASTFASAHDATQPQETYRQTDLSELHAIVEKVRESAGTEQLEEIAALVAAARPELQRLNQAAISAHRRKVDLLLLDVLDRDALEQEKSSEMQAADALSERIDQALSSLAETLTPEQRAQFREHVKTHEG